MISDYCRGWEDALEVALEERDWNKVEDVLSRLREHRIKILASGPFCFEDLLSP